MGKSMTKKIIIVGGGVASWLTACYLGKSLGGNKLNSVKITVIEPKEGMGSASAEGTLPDIRNVLEHIGISEATFIRKCSVTFKQGSKFVNWQHSLGLSKVNDYFHSFQDTEEPDGVQLLPYWLLGIPKRGVNWDEVNTAQKIAADAYRAPKLISNVDYIAPLNYGYHLDVKKFVALLRDTAFELGVNCIVDRVKNTVLNKTGHITSVAMERNAPVSADFFIDGTGARAELIGTALKSPLKPYGDNLFCDTIISTKIPYDEPDAPIPSCTTITAHSAGWISDVGLKDHREIACSYSSAHISAKEVKKILMRYLGANNINVRLSTKTFKTGFRPASWVKNCVAIGEAGCVLEPLESTGISFISKSLELLTALFPWGENTNATAAQYNELMARCYENTFDFIKLHYCISKRRDSDFWIDNVNTRSVPASLKTLLHRWKFRTPMRFDFDKNADIFTEVSWQYVLYGMGFKTDMSSRPRSSECIASARSAFIDIQQKGKYACKKLPSHRELIEALQTKNFSKV